MSQTGFLGGVEHYDIHFHSSRSVLEPVRRPCAERARFSRRLDGGRNMIEHYLLLTRRIPRRIVKYCIFQSFYRNDFDRLSTFVSLFPQFPSPDRFRPRTNDYSIRRDFTQIYMTQLSIGKRCVLKRKSTMLYSVPVCAVSPFRTENNDFRKVVQLLALCSTLLLPEGDYGVVFLLSSLLI